MVAALDQTLPAALVRFLLPETTPFDVQLAPGAAARVPATPGPEVVDVRTRRAAAPVGRGVGATHPERVTGSNGWAIAPSRTATGGAILAGDPHLGLSVPVIWHRQRLESPELGITGVTLPGAP